MKYKLAPDIKERLKEIAEKLNLNFIKTEEVECVRSYGTSTRGVLARCHGLGKVMQLGLKREGRGFYVLEFISERFDKLNEEEKAKIIIHEMMHIPKSFGGGFRHHDFVCDRNIEKLYKEYKNKKNDKN